MDARELRIGNLIYNGIGEVFPVNGETINNFNVAQMVLGNFESIPLTEEWLIRFGFELTGVNSKYYIKDIINEKQDITIEVCIYITNSGLFETGDDLIMTSIHQLQNYVFALTGQELELKEI